MKPARLARLTACAGLVALFVALATGGAHAQGEAGPRLVLLHARGCGLSGEELLSLLRVELRGEGVDRVEPAGPGLDPPEVEPLALVTVGDEGCTHGPDAIAVVVHDLVTQKEVRRILDLSELPDDARARAAALGVAELLRASWAELSLRDTRELPESAAWLRRRMEARPPDPRSTERDDAQPATHERPPPTPPESARALDAQPAEEQAASSEHAPEPGPGSVQAGLFGRTTPEGGAAVLGPSAGLEWLPPGGWLGLATTVRLARGSVDVRLGEATVTSASLALSPRIHGRERGLTASIGPVIELGLVWASGRPDPGVDASSGREGTVLVGASLHLALAVRGPLELHASLGAGRLVRGAVVLVDGEREGGLTGTALDLTVGLSLRLGGGS